MRRRRAERRAIAPDPLYRSERVAKLINMVMRHGKKSLAERIVYGAFDIIRSRGYDDPVSVVERALENTMPVVEVRPRRVGGATYQVPIEVRPERRVSLGMRWLVEAARKRSEKTMQQRLAAELLEAMENRGAAVKKKEDTHRMAEANRAFAHYRW